MNVDPTLDASAPALTQARITVRLHDGRAFTASANGARGYPERPASDDELAAKFLACAMRALAEPRAHAALTALRDIEQLPSITELMAACAVARGPASTP